MEVRVWWYNHTIISQLTIVVYMFITQLLNNYNGMTYLLSVRVQRQGWPHPNSIQSLAQRLGFGGALYTLAEWAAVSGRSGVGLWQWRWPWTGRATRAHRREWHGAPGGAGRTTEAVFPKLPATEEVLQKWDFPSHPLLLIKNGKHKSEIMGLLWGQMSEQSLAGEVTVRISLLCLPRERGCEPAPPFLEGLLPAGERLSWTLGSRKGKRQRKVRRCSHGASGQYPAGPKEVQMFTDVVASPCAFTSWVWTRADGGSEFIWGYTCLLSYAFSRGHPSETEPHGSLALYELQASTKA